MKVENPRQMVLSRKDQQPNLQSHDHISFTEHFGTVYLADKLLPKQKTCIVVAGVREKLLRGQPLGAVLGQQLQDEGPGHQIDFRPVSLWEGDVTLADVLEELVQEEEGYPKEMFM